MIVYDLLCEDGAHRFEGWFGSSDDFAGQQARGLLACPQCGGAKVVKAVMAPRLTRKGNQQEGGRKEGNRPTPAVPPQPPAPLPPEAQAALLKLAERQAEALRSSRWVGDNFARDARAMHYGDKQVEAIHGQATPMQARELIEEGVDIAPVLFPVAPPEDIH